MNGRLLLGAVGFSVAGLLLRRLLGGSPWGELLLLAPPAVASALLFRRGRGEVGRTLWFWRLLAAGPAVWIVAQTAWVVESFRGRDLAVEGNRLVDGLFIGFLVPVIGALALSPHRRRARPEAVALADAALLWVAMGFVFVRLVLVPRQVPLGGQGALLAALALSLALWSGALWRLVAEATWQRVYFHVALFATVYGSLSAVANGSGGPMPPPGELTDLAWIVPFFLLAGAGGGAWKPARSSAWLLLLVAAPGPLVIDLLLDVLMPSASGAGHGAHLRLLLLASALLAVGCAVRLRLQEQSEARQRAEAEARSEEEHRAGRLGALAAVSTTIIQDLQSAVSDVVARAREAADSMGDKADRVLAQAERADRIVRDLARSLALVRPGLRREVDVGSLVEETLRGAAGKGLGLRVRLEGLGELPPVFAEPGALRAAVSHLARNAAQASPGGLLRVSGESLGDEVVLRFKDDGPGVAEGIRTRIFDPFFTTRRVGEGVGLGLTLVHFVARRHGGSVLLDSSEGGACFVLRLPAVERRSESARQRWPLVGAVLVSAALATVLAVFPEGPWRGRLGVFLQLAAAAAATAAFARAAWGRQGRDRTFWGLLGLAPAAWAAASVASLLAHVALGPSLASGSWPVVVVAAADLAWIAALLVRPDRKTEWSAATLLGAGAFLILVLYVFAYLVLLPAPFAVVDVGLRGEVEAARAAQRALLAAWAGAVAYRARSRYWRGVYSWLAAALAVWALGHSAAGFALIRPGYEPGDLSDLGCVVPFLLMAGLALREVRSERRREPEPAFSPYPLRSAAALAALAAVPAFDLLLAGHGGYASLATSRELATRATVLVAGLLLAAREILAHREAAATRILLKGARSQLRSAERRSRLLGLVSSAVHEMSGQLSGIRTLVRLLLAHGQLPERVRTDAERIQANTDAATRVVRNLLAMIRRSPEALTVVPVNDMIRTVVEMRQADLAQEGIRLRALVAAEGPTMPMDGPAIEQVLLGLIDNAAVAIRALGREGSVEIVADVEEDRMVLRVRDDGPGLSETTRRRIGGRLFGGSSRSPGLGLHVAREIVAQHGGTLVARNRPRGGAEFEIRLPIQSRAEEVTAG